MPKATATNVKRVKIMHTQGTPKSSKIVPVSKLSVAPSRKR